MNKLKTRKRISLPQRLRSAPRDSGGRWFLAGIVVDGCAGDVLVIEGETKIRGGRLNRGDFNHLLQHRIFEGDAGDANPGVVVNQRSTRKPQVAAFDLLKLVMPSVEENFIILSQFLVTDNGVALGGVEIEREALVVRQSLQ